MLNGLQLPQLGDYWFALAAFLFLIAAVRGED